MLVSRNGTEGCTLGQALVTSNPIRSNRHQDNARGGEDDPSGIVAAMNDLNCSMKNVGNKYDDVRDETQYHLLTAKNLVV